MSTNAVIHIEGLPEIFVYKHWDGYPEGTLPWLKEFNRKFTAKRPDDPNYKLAQLLRSSIRNARRFRLDKDEFTGWGVFPSSVSVHFDYEYTLMLDGSVVVTKAK